MGRGERNHTLPPLDRAWLYAISDGSGWQGFERLVEIARAGVDLLQIREKLLGGGDLFDFCCRLRAAVPKGGCRLLVNGRLDVGLAAGLDGVHCPSDGLPPARLRAIAPPGFLIGQSCHSVAEVAAADGADFCVLGPIFATPSKVNFGAPLGLPALRAAAACGRPVLALGGVSFSDTSTCLAQGAVGIAGIRMFAELAGNLRDNLRVLNSQEPI